MFSKACEYGIKAAIFIAANSHHDIRVSLSSISIGIDSPKAYTAKVLQQLTKNHIIDSVKGPAGGFAIEKKRVQTLMLREIVSAIDGDAIFTECGLGFQNCNEDQPCPLHYKYKYIRNDLKQMLETTSLFDLLQNIDKGMSFLKRWHHERIFKQPTIKLPDKPLTIKIF